MELMAEAIKELLDIQSIKRVFLVGHSMGGYAVLAFLQLFPEYLSGYSLFHSHPLSDTAEAVEKRKQNIALAENGKKDEMIPGFINGLYAPENLNKLKEAVEKSVSVASGTDKKTIIADLRGMMARPDRTDLVSEGKVPFLWILGTLDSHIDYRAIQQKVRLPENAQIVVLENSGHIGFIEEEELSVKVIEDFVNPHCSFSQ
jgi:pimeloyl-ACP methyl ester carboxylesterase